MPLEHRRRPPPHPGSDWLCAKGPQRATSSMPPCRSQDHTWHRTSGGGPACLCSVAHRRWHQAPLCPPGARCLPTVAAVTHSSRMPGKWLFLSLESESRALSFTKPWAPHLEIGLWSLDTSGETSEFPRGLLKVGRRESWAAGPLCSQYPHASAAPS